MASGQILRNADGKLLLDANGKVKLWAVETAPGQEAGDQWGLFIDRDLIPFTEAEWDIEAAALLANNPMTRVVGGGFNVLRSFWRMDNGSAINLRIAMRYDVSAFDGEDLSIVLEENTLSAADWPGGIQENIDADVEMRFVYELSNIAGGSFSLDTHTHRDMPTFAVLSIQDLLDFGGVPFALSLPDTTGFDYLYVGLEIEWIFDTTLAFAFDSDAHNGHPVISCHLHNARIVQTS